MYSVILADPPWRYDFSKSDSRQIENHYPTMTVPEICAYQFPRNPNSVLYLWATAPKLYEALAVMMAWGYEYKTHGVWDKQIIGMGYWFRGQHELLLVGVSGKFSPPDPEVRISSIISERRGKHSKKPIAVYEMIERAYPHLMKLELFARVHRDGWDAKGNEID